MTIYDDYISVRPLPTLTHTL